MKNEIRLLGKGRERFAPMVKPLKELLIAEMRQRQQQNEFYVDDLVVRYTADVVTKEFRKALKKIGAYSKAARCTF